VSPLAAGALAAGALPPGWLPAGAAGWLVATVLVDRLAPP
jgi:hypothetical protein